MCGITAIFDATDGNLRPLVETMTSTLRHRGPDDADIWQSEGGPVALGHRRLSIIDLSPLGRNPMAYQDRYWITFNGEIYNFRVLRNELEHVGYRFRSQTDTEVILAAYDHWGAECLLRFVGMFAFVLWDVARGEMFLARDRVGKKPLYYAEYGGRIAVASELKAIVADSRFPRIVDPRAVAQYLRYGYVPAPLSIYAHARKLPPGHYAIVRRGRVETFRYWDPVPFADADEPVDNDPQASERRLEELLRDAVGLRMLADVPVGAFLSGGIDSSLIVALMQEQSASAVKTFTIRFDDPAFNEADHAAAVARHLKTDHYEQTCDARQMLDVVDMLPDAFDEPFADSSAIPTSKFRRAAHVLRSDAGDRYERFISWWSGDDVRKLTGDDAETSPAYFDVRQRAVHLDQNLRPSLIDLVTYLPDDILTKVDRASMQVSLETRCPLLDHRVVEYALQLPLDLKWRTGTTKWLLRRLLYRRVPQALVDRPKMGFGVPLTAWLRGPLRQRVDGLFDSRELEAVGIDPTVARAEWRQFRDSRSDKSHSQIWNLFALAAWAARWQPQPSASATV
jgi:asparagine synthase (glutamine-hydrolysing)